MTTGDRGATSLGEGARTDLPAIAEGNIADFDRVLESGIPTVFRSLVSSWPAVVAGAASSDQLCSYLSRFDGGMAVEAFVAPPNVGGRFFYADDMKGFNFERPFLPLGQAMAMMLAEQKKGRRNGIYVGSTPIRQVLPGFERENNLPQIGNRPAEARIWLGTESTVAPHFDVPNNIACVVSGRRRFTLFPPSEIANLYVGPIDVTIAGPPASMVNISEPDFERFPRFRKALAAASVAELEPGDAIYIPALWWHNVEALSPFNMLVNYWWQDAPPDAGPPLACIGHGILTISQLPRAQREAWREMFDYWVFRLHGDPAAHIPVHARGVLGESSVSIRQRIKEFLRRSI